MTREPIPQARFRELIAAICKKRYTAEDAAKFGEIEDWDTSRVTDMSKAFRTYPHFNRDISRWDVSRVTNMSGMFFGAEVFDQPLERWDTGRVTDMSYMFYGARVFNRPLERWDTGRVTNMQGMFFAAKTFRQSLARWTVTTSAARPVVLYLTYGDMPIDDNNPSMSLKPDWGRVRAPRVVFLREEAEAEAETREQAS